MAIDTLDRSASTELITIPYDTEAERRQALDTFTSKDKLKPYIDQIRAHVAGFEPDLSTVTSRDRIKSMAFKVRQSKAYLVKIKDTLYKEQSEIPKKLTAAQKYIEGELDALAETVRAPLTKWEADEKARCDKHHAEIAQITAKGATQGKTSDQVKHDIANLNAMDLDERCEEFLEDYKDAHRAALNSLNAYLPLVEQAEQERAELARLRAEDAKRKAKEADEAAAKAKRDAAIKAQIAALAVEDEDEPQTIAVTSRAEVTVQPAAIAVTSVVDATTVKPSQIAKWRMFVMDCLHKQSIVEMLETTPDGVSVKLKNGECFILSITPCK